MTSPKRRDDSLGRSADQLGKFDVGWAFVIVFQVVLGILVLTERDTRSAGKAQGALLLISVVAILYSLLLVPRIGLAKHFHPTPVVSLVLGVASLMFVIDFSLLAKHGVAIGVVSVMAGLLALRNIAAAWRNRFRG